MRLVRRRNLWWLLAAPLMVLVVVVAELSLAGTVHLGKAALAEDRITTLAGEMPSEAPARTLGQRPSGLAVSGGTLYVSDSANDVIWAVDLATGIERRVAGIGGPGFTGGGGVALDTHLNGPTGLAIGPGSQLYIADSGDNQVLALDLLTGRLRVVAGDGSLGSTGNGGPAVDASLGSPTGLAVSGHTLYIADTLGNQVRAVDLDTGVITTVAGTGSYGHSGDGGPATEATFAFPADVAVSGSTLYVADTDNSMVRALNLLTGIVTRIAGTGLAGYSGNGGPARSAALDSPDGLAVSGDTLYISDHANDQVRALNLATGDIEAVAGTAAPGFSGDGSPALQARFHDPTGLAVGPHGAIYVADTGNLRVRRVGPGPDALVSTVAGNGTVDFSGTSGPAIDTELAVPSSVAVSAHGAVYIADTGANLVLAVDPSTGRVTTVAGNGTANPLVFHPQSPPGPGSALEESLDAPVGLAISPSGRTLYVADQLGEQVLAIDLSSGSIAVVMGTGSPAGLADPSHLRGHSAAGTGVSLDDPTGLAVSPGGRTLYVADSGAGEVLALDLTTGVARRVAGSGGPGGYCMARGEGKASRVPLDDPTGLAVSPDGRTLYIADLLANCIQAVDLATGAMAEVAGQGTATPLAFPWGLSTGRHGSLFVADKDANEILRIPAVHGRVRASSQGARVAGTGLIGDTGDGGPAWRAELDQPTGVAVGPHGDLFIADGGDGTVRRVQAPFAIQHHGIVAAPGLSQLDLGSSPPRGFPAGTTTGGTGSAAAPTAVAPMGGTGPPGTGGVIAGSSATGSVVAGGSTRATGSSVVRATILGDSVALTLGDGLGEVGRYYGVRVADDGILGCGILDRGSLANSGVVYPATPVCVHWASMWREDMASSDPEVSAILIGRWEVVNRMVGGRWSHVGEPALDAELLAAIRHAVSIAGEGGVPVVLMSAPYYEPAGDPAAGMFPETNPLRVDELDAILSEVPDWYPGQVSFLPLGSLLDPGGHWSFVVGGVVARWAEGVHVTPAGGRMLAGFLLPFLRSAALHDSTG